MYTYIYIYIYTYTYIYLYIYIHTHVAEVLRRLICGDCHCSSVKHRLLKTQIQGTR